MKIADEIARPDAATRTAPEALDSDAEPKPTHSIECRVLEGQIDLQVCDQEKLIVASGQDEDEDNVAIRLDMQLPIEFCHRDSPCFKEGGRILFG